MEAIIKTLTELNWISTLFRIMLSLVLGSIIGFERGKHGRAAGLRTHVLVSLGSAMSAMVGIYIVSTCRIGGDPTRIASGVVSGIGFLGAGMILVKNSSKVTGLTTAAAMWATSTVGLAIGGGFYIGAIAGALAIVATTAFMTVFEIRQKKDRRFFIEIEDVRSVIPTIRNIEEKFPTAHSVDVLPSKSGVGNHVGIAINITNNDDDNILIDEIMKIDGVVFVVEA